jgi:hypothetical protein
MSQFRSIICLICLALIFCVPGVQAQTTLTFEGIGDQQPIGNFYAAQGITFGPDALGLISIDYGGSGLFDPNTPTSTIGKTVMYFLTGPGDVMDVPTGFNNSISFYYSAPFFPGSLTLYSGLDGAGTVLNTSTLSLTPTGTNVGYNFAFDPLVQDTITFSGTAESAIFSGTANFIIFDNVTLTVNSASNPPGTPEPGAMALIGAGCLGVFMFLRQRRA